MEVIKLLLQGFCKSLYKIVVVVKFVVMGLNDEYHYNYILKTS